MIKPPIKTTIQELPYLELGWELFERLCKRLVAEEEPEATEVRLYLSQGYKQHGIDGYAYAYEPYNSQERKYVHFQCKCEESFTANKIKDAVDTYLEGDLAKGSRKFILCVSAQINNSYENELIKQRQRLANEGIEFIIWDQLKLDDLLKNYPQLVYDFFDGSDVKNWVSAFCGSDKAKEVHKLVEPKDYIKPAVFVNRMLYPINQEVEKIEDNRWPSTLIDLLTNEILTKNSQCRIFLQSEAGMGKSTELLNAAHYLRTYNLTLIFPVLLQLKNYVDEDIPTWLDEQQPGWRGLELSTLLLLFDGLDEVKSEKREEFIRKVRGFMDAHPFCHVLISCRTNFATSRLQFNTFKVYELRPFDENDIVTYARKVIPEKQIASFLDRLEDHSLNYGLENPFSLNYFTQYYKTNPNTTLKTRSELLAKVVELKSKDDQIRYQIDHPEAYSKLLKRLAFIMNLLGVNSLNDNELLQIFPDAIQYERCRQSSLLKVIENQTSFEHNILQEYFAALELSVKPIERLKDWVSFRPDHKKLKSKWFNTIGILLEILPKDSQILNDVVNLVSVQEPQLLMGIEYGHFDSNLRVEIFKTIFNSSNRKYFYDVYYDIRLLSFADINNNPDVIGFLIEQADNGLDWQRAESFYYLSHADRNQLFGYENELIEVSIKALKNESSLVQEKALEAVRHLKLSNPVLIELVTGSMPNLNLYKIRDNAYQYLNALGCSEQYIDFYLQGYLIYLQDNSDNHEAFFVKMGPGFIDGLKAMMNPQNLSKIITLIISNIERWRDNSDFFEKDFNEDEKFFDIFASRLAVAYKTDNSLYSQVLSLCYVANKRHLANIFKPIAKFFELTGTQKRAFWDAFSLDDDEHSYLVSGWIVNELILDDCIHRFEKGQLKEDKVWNIIQSLTMRKKVIYLNSFVPN